jgi:hypothetical protein
MTYESHSGQFSTADGLFGFDDVSLYFDIVEQSDRLQLVVNKEMPGGEFCIHAMNESHKNDLGELLNYDYFVDLPSSIEISGTIQHYDIVQLNGNFSFEIDPNRQMDIASGLSSNLYDLDESQAPSL